MTKLIKTDSEILNLVLKSLYVNEVWENEILNEEAELPFRRPDNE
ncbi:MAG: hypothetical protein ACE5QF_10000 [Thermoplasmata archaeon]